MQQKTIIFLFVILISACSSNKKSKNTKLEVVSNESGEIHIDGPKWITASNGGCSKREICAVGEGSSFADSDANAKAAIASIFETHIQSQFKTSTESFSKSDLYEMQESVSSAVTEQVDQAIQAVVIKEKHHNQKLYYSQASMSKSKVSKILKEKIRNIDTELSELVAQGKRLALRRMNILYNQREQINEKLVIVRGMGVPKQVDLKDLQDLKFKKIKNNKLKFSGQNIPQTLVKKFKEELTGLGYIFESKKADYVIKGQFKAEEAYLKVKGFKKINYTFDIRVMNSDNEEVGSFVIEHTQTGRTPDQAFNKALPMILEKMQNKIELLNL